MVGWLRIALIYTALMNLIGAVLFTPFFRGVQAWAGFPDAPDLYLWSQSSFIFGMGLTYTWMAATRTPNRLVLALACYGKAAFAATLIGCTLAGQTPVMVAVSGLPDLALSVAFGVWLYQTRC